MTITTANAQATADALNAAFAAGTLHTVNGREVTSAYGTKVATAWQNGTVSVTVKGRAKRTTGTVYVKAGQDLHTA